MKIPEFEIDNFDNGWINDVDPVKLPVNAASLLQNAYIPNRYLEKLPGTDNFIARLGQDWIDDLPANTVIKNAVQLRLKNDFFNAVAEPVLLYAQVSGVDKLFIRPYIRNAVWTDDYWQDLTEKEGTYTTEAGTTTTLIYSSELLIDDTNTDMGVASYNAYYDNWIVVNTTKGAASIVTDYDPVNKTLALAWAITGQTTGNSFWLMRNPVYDKSGNALFLPEDDKVRFLLRDNNVIDVLTGSDSRYSSGAKCDLTIQLINYSAFDDSDWTFTGIYLTRKHLDYINTADAITLSSVATSGSDVKFPDNSSNANGLLVTFIPVYDGYQDGPLEPGVSPFDGTIFSSGNFILWGTGANRKLQIDIDLYTAFNASNEVPLRLPNGAIDYAIFDRRITALKVYVAEGYSPILADTRPFGDWRHVETVQVDDGAWNGGGPNYTQTIYITGDKWAANAGVSITDDQGHSSIKVHANAKYAAASRDRIFYANVYVDKQRKGMLFYSAINGASVPSPHVIPHTNFIPLDFYSLFEINGVFEMDGVVTVIAQNKIIRVNASTLAVDKNHVNLYSPSSNGLKKIDRLLYIANYDDIFVYYAHYNTIKSITVGRIRELWRGLSDSDKESCALGYDARYGFLVVAVGSRAFYYKIPVDFASDLATDESPGGHWGEYISSYTFVGFFTALKGQCVGITSTGILIELFADTPDTANAMQYDSFEADGDILVEDVGMAFTSAQDLTLEFYDTSESATYPKKSFTFKAQSTRRRVSKFNNFKIDNRMKIRLKTPSFIGSTQVGGIYINKETERV